MLRVPSRSLLAALMLVAALFPARAEAVELRSGASVVVGPNERVDDDLYVTGNEITISGTVNGNVFAIANSLHIDGVINGSLTVMGNSVAVTGRVRDNVQVVAGQVRIAGNIGRDVLAAAWNSDLATGSTIGRDVYLAIGTGNIASEIGRDVKAAGAQVGLNAQVGRSVDVLAETVDIGSGTRVAGDFRYRSEKQAQIPPGVQIGGAVEQVQTEPRREPSAAEVAGSAILDRLRGLVTPLVIGLAALWLLPLTTQGIAATARQRPVMSAGVGLGFLVVIPIIGVFLTVVGILLGGFALGLLLLTGSWVLVIASRAVAGLALGEALLRRFRPEQAERNGVALVVGLVLLALLSFIPIVDTLLNFVIALLGSGAVLLWVWESYHKLRMPPAIRPLEGAA